VLESIGRGTFSVVRKCRHLATGDVRAVKCIDTHRFRLSASFDSDRLLEEVRILSSLRHPHIITLYDVYFSQQEEAIFSVTELAQGGELFDSILASGNFSEAQARHVVWQVLSALAFMHRREVVHRDIKPENILVFGSTQRPASNPHSAPEPMLNVKLADFGTSRMLAGAGASTFVGSPQYVAPEILFAREGAGRYGTKVDVWSVGVTLFAMLAGYLPFDDAAHPGDTSGWEARIKAGTFRFAPP
ncbi:SIK2, partial [Symbiodinium sp. KB8]